MASSYRYKHIAATGSFNGIAGAGATLGVVSVNTGGAGSVLTIYDAATVAAGTAANTIAVIDCAASTEKIFACYVKTGVSAGLATANADITITYE